MGQAERVEKWTGQAYISSAARVRHGRSRVRFSARGAYCTVGKDFGEVPNNPQKTTKTKNINPLQLNIIEGVYTKYENEE